MNWLIGAAVVLAFAIGAGCPSAQEIKEREKDSEAVEVFLTECLEFIGEFGLNPEPDNKILNTALDLLIEALPDTPRDVKPSVTGRDREEALFIFSGVLDKLVNLPGQRLDRKSLAEKAVGLYVETVDPYSRYRTNREMESLVRAMETPGAGVGMEIQEELGRLICFPFPDSSADAAGIPIGGRLLTVEGKSVEGKSLPEVAGLIRGPEGASVSLRVENSSGRSRIYTMKRESIDTPMLLIEQILGNRVILKIRKINEACLDELRAFAKNKDVDYLTVTLDLRSCPGGDLESAVNIADLFLPVGAPIGAAESSQMKKAFQATTPIQIKFKNLVLLYNKGTASAAEFLIGSLMSNRDTLRVSMQGEGTTYGKAVAQESRHVSTGGLLQLTTTRLYMPNGRTWQDTGLTPDDFRSQP